MAKDKRWQFQQKYPVDRCPKCKTLLSKKCFAILWRDVLECTHCGHVWVLDNPDQLKCL